MDIRKAVCEADSLELVDSLDNNKCRFHMYARDLLGIIRIPERKLDIHLQHIYVSHEANASSSKFPG